MKYAILKVSPYIFVDMCRYGMTDVRIVQNAIPRDAKFIRASCDDHTGWGYINLTIESQEFKELKEGDLIPVLPFPVFEKK